MNLNASVVRPINKARSVKLNGRNMQESRMDALTLDSESTEMEKKLQQLKNSMCKEKEERRHSRGLRWTSGKYVSIRGDSLPSSFKKNKETKGQMMPAGKQKIRVLKEESLSAPSKPPRSAPVIGCGLTKESRLRGKNCGQSEVKAAGLVFAVNDGEGKVGVTEYELGLPSSLLTGQYSEEESKEYFQEALRQWRGERSNGDQAMTTDAMWTPVRSDVQSCHPSLDLCMDSKSSPTTETVDDTASNLTGEEKDFEDYYTSLFAVPVSRGRTEPQTFTPEPCLVIEILDETCSDTETPCAAEQKMDKNRDNRSSRAGLSSPSKKQPSRQSGDPVQSQAAKKLHSSQTSQPEHSVKALSFKSRIFTHPTALTPGTSKKSAKKTTTNSHMSICSPSSIKSKANCGSPLILSLSPDIPKYSLSAPSFFAEVSARGGDKSAIPEENSPHSPTISCSLRSTFTVSPSSSTQSALLPKVYHPALLQTDSDSSLLSEKLESFQLFAEPISSPKLRDAPKGNLISRQQSQYSMCDPDCLLLENQLDHTLPPLHASPHSKPESLELIRSRLSPMPCHISAGKYEDAPVCMSSTSMSGDQKLTQLLQDPQCSSSSLKVVINNLVKREKVKELSIDSGDEMSSDSLGLNEEDSSGEETQMKRHLTREKSKEENHNPRLSHLEDSFMFAEVETKKDLKTDGPEQQSKSFMVMQKQSAGSGSEQFCDLDGFLPLGLDTDTGHLGSPEHAHCEPLFTRHSSVQDSDPTGCSLSDKPTPILCNPPRTTPRPLYIPTASSLFCSPSPPLSAHLPHLTSGPEFRPASRPFSRGTREIMEICGLDQTGCEDPDLEMDTTVHMLQSLEEELRVIANGLQSARNKGKRRKPQRETDKVSFSYPETQTQQSCKRLE